MFPLFDPNVTLIVFVVLIPVLPLGKLQVYPVAPEIPVTVYNDDVPIHGAAFPLTTPVPVGALLIAIACAVPKVMPQPLIADTFTFPAVEPKFTVTEALPWPLATVAPAGTVQL